MLSHTKMTSKERFPANEAFSQIFDSESDLEENVPDTEDNLEEHDYEASSSDEIKWSSSCLSTGRPITSRNVYDIKSEFKVISPKDIFQMTRLRIHKAWEGWVQW